MQFGYEISFEGEFAMHVVSVCVARVIADKDNVSWMVSDNVSLYICHRLSCTTVCLETPKCQNL